MIIGLTGGIASGKSSVGAQLREWGAHVIDADKLGHKAYLSGSAAFDAVVATFGEDVVGEDGEVDRRVLGSKVFGSPEKLKQLTDIVWPAIRQMAAEEIATVQAKEPDRLIVLEAAVLLEAGWQNLVDTIWVTVVDPQVAVQRASKRDGLAPEAVQTRIDAQLSNAARISQADHTIDNSGSPEQLKQQLKQLWENVHDS